MLKLLFVDDEPRVLESLRRQLHFRRGEWEFHFATSARAALETLRRGSIDAIVTDIRMPGMDGAALLEEVGAQYPDTIRIVLSGHCDGEVAACALALAHRYVSKPCDARTLASTLDQALALRHGVHVPQLRALLHRVGDLPHAPMVLQELERELTAEEPSFDRIARSVAGDPGLAARVLKFANSAYFSGSEATDGIDAAVARLGTNVLRSLLLTALVHEHFPSNGSSGGADLTVEFRHAMHSASIARSIVGVPALADSAFTGALLHDVGKLVMATRLPDVYPTLLRAYPEGGGELPRLEQETFGATHADLGAYLLELWGLPPALVEAVRNHHEPKSTLPDPLDATSAIMVADRLARLPGIAGAGDLAPDDARWPRWHALAEDVLSRS